MLNLATLARPYARAAFEVADAAGTIEQWTQALGLAGEVLGDGDVQRVIHDPRVESDQVFALITGIGGERLDAGFGNFLRVLLQNKRLDLLPEITAQFEVLRSEAERRLTVQVTSAIELDEDQQARLRERLNARFGRDIDLELEIDPGLIGGVVIHAGDQVIDGSVRGRLSRLAQQFTD